MSTTANTSATENNRLSDIFASPEQEWGANDVGRKAAEGGQNPHGCVKVRPFPATTIVSHSGRRQARCRWEEGGALFRDHANNDYEVTLLRGEYNRRETGIFEAVAARTSNIQENISSARFNHKHNITI